MYRFSNILIALLGCYHLNGQPFLESSRTLGIDHVHVSPNYFGGGIAILDINNDGYEDIYFTGGSYEDKLYLNRAGHGFEDITETSGIYPKTRIVSTTAVTTGDINNDGLVDILICTGPGQTPILYINYDNNIFLDGTSLSGIADNSWNMGAVLADFNMDGYLDIYVINYIEEYEAIFNEQNEVVGFNHLCSPNSLYINNGDLTFTERSEQYGVDDIGCGLAVQATDLNGDFLPDILIANDFGAWIEPNKALINEFPSTSFSDASNIMNLDLEIYGMGIAQSDFDGDGDLDYYFTNIGRNVLMKNNGGVFEDITDQMDVSNTYSQDKFSAGWGTVFFDADNDGNDELFLANGYIPSAAFIETAETDQDVFFTLDSIGDYRINLDFPGYTGPSRGAVTADLNNDGQLELIVATTQITINGTRNNLVYLNNDQSNHNWCKLMLKGNQSNPQGFNTLIKAYYEDKLIVREVVNGGSHASQGSSIVHLGLGNTVSLDSVELYWPKGGKQTFRSIESNHLYLAEEGANELNILGCTDPQYVNFDQTAQINYGCGDLKLYIGNKDEIIVFPNPADRTLQIKSSSQIQEYKLYDEGFRLILVDEGNNSINVSELPSGIYWLGIQQENTMVYRKVIIGD